jgi:hypothetical protein
MFRNRRIQIAAAALAMTGATMALAQTAEARPRHYSRALHVTRFLPATMRAGYVGAPGYPYGPPGPIQPVLIDPGVGGGLLGIGVLPATGIFTGFPILGDLRL